MNQGVIRYSELILTCNKCNHKMEVSLDVNINKSDEKLAKVKVRRVKEVRKLQDTNLLSLENIVSKDVYTNIKSKPSFPLCVQVKYRGFWITDESGIHQYTEDDQTDRNSVMFANDCLLYVYKLALRHLLLSMKVITPYDIDPANLVPHMVVRKNKMDPFSKYKIVQGEKFIITDEMLSAKSDFLIMEIDEKRDLHTTLIYSKKIKHRVNLIEAIKTVVQTLNGYPHLIKEYESLSYFGQNAIEYWYNNGNNYPFNVTPPGNYKPKEQETNNVKLEDVLPSGTITNSLQ